MVLDKLLLLSSYVRGALESTPDTQSGMLHRIYQRLDEVIEELEALPKSNWNQNSLRGLSVPVDMDRSKD